MRKRLFVKVSTLEKFNNALQNGTIDLNSVTFIVEPKMIWAQGEFYHCPYTKTQIDTFLTEIVQDTNTKLDSVKALINALKGSVTDDYNTLAKLEAKIKYNASEINKVKADLNAAQRVLNTKIEGLKIVKTTATGNNAASYELRDVDGVKKGVTIDIPKDQSIKDIKMSTTDATLDSEGMIVDGPAGNSALCISYILANGSYKLAVIDYSKFLEEAEFSDGLTVDNHRVKIKINADSTDYLNVTSNGLSAAKTKQKIQQLSNTVSSNKTTIDNYTVNGHKISTNPTLKASDIPATGYTVNSGNPAPATDSILTVVGKVHNIINVHAGKTNNPHNVTKEQVGLGAVNNTSDEAKPLSLAARNANAALSGEINGIKNKIGANNGIAELDNTGKLKVSQRPVIILLCYANVTYSPSGEVTNIQLFENSQKTIPIVPQDNVYYYDQERGCQYFKKGSKIYQTGGVEFGSLASLWQIIN